MGFFKIVYWSHFFKHFDQSQIPVLALTKNFLLHQDFDCSKWPSLLNISATASTNVPTSLNQHTDHLYWIKNYMENIYRFTYLLQVLSIFGHSIPVLNTFLAIIYIDKNFNIVEFYDNGINNFLYRNENKSNFIIRILIRGDAEFIHEFSGLHKKWFKFV